MTKTIKLQLFMLLFVFISGISFQCYSQRGAKKIDTKVMNINEKVTNLKVSAVSIDRLDLTWDAIPNASGYRIYRGSARGFLAGDNNLIAVANSNAYANRELSPSSTYFYKVSPLNSIGESTLSDEVSGTTKQKDLALLINKTLWTVEGDAFKITWDAAKGGEITEIRQYDGLNWVRINGDNNLHTIPGYVLKGDIQYFLSNCPEAVFQVIKSTPDEIVFRAEGTPQTSDGKKSDWIIKQTFHIFKEGLLFCDLEMNLPAGSNSFNISYGKFGLTMGSQPSKKLNWGYFKRDAAPMVTWKSTSDKVIEKCMYPYVGIDYGVGEKSIFTNHVAFFVEDWKALAGPKEMSGANFAMNSNSEMCYDWVLYEGDGTTIKAPYSYRNRWGLGLGAMRKSSRSNLSASRGNNLIGARYFHYGPGPQGYPAGADPDDWPWYLHPNFWSQPAKAKIYPTDELIDEVAKLGANVFVLHQSWMRNGGSNTWPPADYTAQNPEELKRVIDRCHLHGMRFGLYMRGTEAYSLYIPFFEKFLQKDWDGLYVDWNGPLYFSQNNQAAFKPSEIHFDAYAYFRYTKMLRERVGENGFLIGHAWAEPTIFGIAVFDAYLPGEWIDQKQHLMDSPEKYIYFSHKTSCGTQLISYTEPREKAVAYSAGMGSGIMSERGLLWQVLRPIPMEKVWFYDNVTENLQVVTPSNPAFYSTVYKVSNDLLLLVTANTGEKGSSALQLDISQLGLIGKYTVTEYYGTDLKNFTSKPYGTIDNGTINTGLMVPYEIKSFKLERVR